MDRPYGAVTQAVK